MKIQSSERIKLVEEEPYVSRKSQNIYMYIGEKKKRKGKKKKTSFHGLKKFQELREKKKKK